ncbi:hypothetical protein LTR04_001056 [Oleoguttula sp. CCFEE 6159]|nr:hypothetical protein LTR04_001056 [Oleoguttula sp. CCFEE 6159]
MFFTKALLFGASLVGAVIAQSSTLAFTSVPAVVTAGQPANISYMAADTTSPVTITLRKGDPNNLATIAVLTSSSTGGSYIWIPDKSLANAQDYALQITQGVSAINYSGLITLVGSDTVIQLFARCHHRDIECHYIDDQADRTGCCQHGRNRYPNEQEHDHEHGYFDCKLERLSIRYDHHRRC